jgi:HEAT repeat protein
MADNTLQRLISLIASSEDLEVRKAAVRVAGALKPSKERALNQALVGLLSEQDLSLRGLAVEALGEARADEALPRLVELVQGAGPEVEGAVRAIGHLGARGTKALGQVMHAAGPALRRRIAAVLALAGTESAVLATAASLLDEDPGVVEASAKSLAAEVPLLSAAQKRTLAEHLLPMVAPAKRRQATGRQKPTNKTRSEQQTQRVLAPVSEAAILRVLAALHAPEAEELYWSRLDSHYPPSLRSAALQALSALPLAGAPARLQKLLDCAAASEFQVVAPALMLLKKVPASRKTVKHWLGLLDAPDVAAHLLAVEKLRDIDSADVAGALLKQLRHPDKTLRDNALAALCELKSGRDTLYGALLEAENPDEAWLLARAQVKPAAGWTPAMRAKAFAEACKQQEGDDRRADALWFLLRESDGTWLRSHLEERALALRKKKKFAASLTYWRLLTRDPAVGSDLRFQLAATALKLSNHDISAAAREAEPALQQFSRILQDSTFDLFGQIRMAKWLEPEDLFYLGFHFAEQHMLAKEFGKKVLLLLVERSPKSALAKNARQKLKSEGA